VKTVLGNKDVLSDIPKAIFKNKLTFRVIASDENETVSINRSLLIKAEDAISRKLKLKINRSLPDLELWFLKRSEGYGFIGIRITRTPNYEKTLQKGELRPELANLMCIMGDLEQSDAVIDPFAGYGSIPIECAKSFKVKNIIAGEKDKEIFKLLEKKVKESGLKIVLGRWNALKLTSLTNNSVDKIITDPPWGLFEENGVDIEVFYEKMLDEFSRILKPASLLVLLTAQKEVLEKVINRNKTFNLLDKYDVLISGKKAAIYKIGVGK
jgi:23S rRNA G2445 N2-methylase RlmL